MPALSTVLGRLSSEFDDVASAARGVVREIRSELRNGPPREASGPERDDAKDAILAELAEALVLRAARLAQEASDISSILGRARMQLAHGQSGEAVASEPIGLVRSSASPQVSDGMRVLVTRMAAAGRTREEIEVRLRHDFGIEAASAALGEVLGSTR